MQNKKGWIKSFYTKSMIFIFKKWNIIFIFEQYNVYFFSIFALIDQISDCDLLKLPAINISKNERNKTLMAEPNPIRHTSHLVFTHQSKECFVQINRVNMESMPKKLNSKLKQKTSTLYTKEYLYFVNA